MLSLPLLFLAASITTTTAKTSSAPKNTTITKFVYSPNTTYQGSTFFQNFDFVDEVDSAGSGFASYVNQSVAEQNGMISMAADGAVRIGVDDVSVINKQAKGGRKAVRLNSKMIYEYGLFVADFSHMPGGICGTWPAYWMSGPVWPIGGELDILEGVNQNTHNKITGYTNATGSCHNTNAQMLANLTSSDCTDLDDTGCSMLTPSPLSYGSAFNSNNGGIYAVEWSATSGIKVWFWARNDTTVPSDLNSTNPDPSTWGTPMANIPAQDCNMQSHFWAMQLVINTNFCGGWGKRDWKMGECSKLADTCEEYVRENPKAFAEAYWEVNYIKSFSGKDMQVVVPVNGTDKTSGASAGVRPPVLLRLLGRMLRG